MPCVSCGARQVDPVPGRPAWQRVVRRGEQVLVCPACATRPGWDDDLDRCPACGSLRLRRALGRTTCRACGREWD